MSAKYFSLNAAKDVHYTLNDTVMEKKKKSNPLIVTYLASVENANRFKQQAKQSIESSEKVAIAPILLALKQSVPREWKRFFKKHFSFSIPVEGDGSKLRNMFTILLQARNVGELKLYCFTEADLQRTGFESVSQCIKTLSSLNKAWKGLAAISELHEVLGIQSYPGGKQFHLIFFLGEKREIDIQKTFVKTA